MRLTKARVQNFRSIDDSGEFAISDLTCLVGKNEAGKTALLQALLGINSVSKFTYNKVRDYPRRYLNRYDERHPTGVSLVVTTDWQLSASDRALLVKRFGAGVTGDRVTIENYMGPKAATLWSMPIDEKECLRHLMQKHSLSDSEAAVLTDSVDGQSAAEALKGTPGRTSAQEALLKEISKCSKNSFAWAAIDILAKVMPKFFYTSHFDRMSGEISLSKLAADKGSNSLSTGDQIFLEFLDYAGTSIEELQSAKKYEDLKAKCEGASNDITDEILQFWSQNDALAVKIDLADGKTGDPAPFNAGIVAKIRIENGNHRVSIPLSERSAGFLWFFSFLAQFRQLKKKAKNVIVLLDEPGLSLHGKAQADLLKFIRERLLPDHQVIYTTHSPFMVPIDRFADVRIVEDVIDYDERQRPVVRGTKVRSDVYRFDQDTIFPLQGALGYEITRQLFLAKNSLLVETPSDILYLYAASQALKERSRVGLDERWTICPCGGIEKIAPFVSLFGANTLNVAVLTSVTNGDKDQVERLKKSQILRAGRLYTVAEFSGKSESDLEDLFDVELYASLLNETFALKRGNALNREKLEAADASERLVRKAEAAFRSLPASGGFSRYAPADWLIRNPHFLAGNAAIVTATLDRFEAAFKALNSMLPEYQS